MLSIQAEVPAAWTCPRCGHEAGLARPRSEAFFAAEPTVVKQEATAAVIGPDGRMSSDIPDEEFERDLAEARVAFNEPSGWAST